MSAGSRAARSSPRTRAPRRRSRRCSSSAAACSSSIPRRAFWGIATSPPTRTMTASSRPTSGSRIARASRRAAGRPRTVFPLLPAKRASSSRWSLTRKPFRPALSPEFRAPAVPAQLRTQKETDMRLLRFTGAALVACALASTAAFAGDLTTVDLTPLINQAIGVAGVALSVVAAWIGHRFVQAYAGDKVEGLWIQATDEAIAAAKKRAQLYARNLSGIDLHNFLLKEGVEYFMGVWPELWKRTGTASPEAYVRKVLEAALGIYQAPAAPHG